MKVKCLLVPVGEEIEIEDSWEFARACTNANGDYMLLLASPYKKTKKIMTKEEAEEEILKTGFPF